MVPESGFRSERKGERKNYTSQWAVKGKWGSENRASPPAAFAFRCPPAEPTAGGRGVPVASRGYRAGPGRAVPVLPLELAGERTEIKRANSARREVGKKGSVGEGASQAEPGRHRHVLRESGRGPRPFHSPLLPPRGAWNPAGPGDLRLQPPSRCPARLAPSLPILAPGTPTPRRGNSRVPATKSSRGRPGRIASPRRFLRSPGVARVGLRVAA